MKIIKFLFSPVFMGTLFVIFAVAMATATFIENDFGSSASYSMVYDTRWFELILVLLATNLIGQIVILKLLRRKRLPVALFHLAFVVMLLGAGITRYFGWEGTIHIREGETSAACLSSAKYIGYSVKDKNGKVISEYSAKYNMNSRRAENFKKKIIAGNNNYELLLARVIPNAAKTISDSPEGKPLISLVVTDRMMTRETIILKEGETAIFDNISIGFAPESETDVTIYPDSGIFSIISKYDFSTMSMMSEETTSVRSGEKVPLKPMQIINVKEIRIIPQKLSLSGIMKAVSVNSDEQKTGLNAFIFHIFSGNRSETIYLWDKESDVAATGSCKIDGLDFDVSYGSKISTLPFSLKLDDFILERYPGSNSPSGYKSNVMLMDEKLNIRKPFSIYMNNVLKYRGFRFYQSSFDKDEAGTILSVNHDMAGMLVSYAGYALMFLFIMFSLFSKNSQFRNITASAWFSPLRKSLIIAGFALVFMHPGSVAAQKLIPSKTGSEEFGKVLVQDQKGRTKPLFTLSSDILRKVTKENKFEGYTPMQVFLGLYLDFNNWKDVSLIRVSNKDLQKKIGITGNYAAFSDLVDLEGNGTYKLSEAVNAAYARSPAERNKIDKEVMKVDERVNIVYMIYKGDFMKIIPLKDGTHNWGTADEAILHAAGKEDSLFLRNIVPSFSEALESNNNAAAKQLSQLISQYQERFSQYSLPPGSKTSAEMLYYKMGIFEKLFPFYSTAGMIMLIGLIIMVIQGKKETSLFIRVISWLLLAGFLFHTFGLALRWYVSGHSPMSNGYESMIFISWVTILAGFIFSRKSAFALSATAVLGGMTLMVAHLSFMDPEITNLVPVLKSYWLTLHVSVITGSYGFLGLGAILGIITLVLLALSNKKNIGRISNTIDDLTVINFKTLILGLYFLTIGTFLGAVWANESWGRYWGWDPKETWSLITIVVYSFVTHSRLIPGLKDIFTFNLLSLFAFFSVLMTYFGVNYYLSGLHSYASGDPVSIPGFVYIAVILLITLSVIAYLKYSRIYKENRK